jgi:hypothetical protein
LRRGISFELPNEYGSLLGDVLQPIDITVFTWRIGAGEIYMVEDNQLSNELFIENRTIIDGAELKNRIEGNKYYIIFADLQAFPKGEFSAIDSYDQFLGSKCELVLIVVDCSYATIYCKNKKDLELLYINAGDYGFKNVEYITDENDTRTGLSVW